MMGAVTSTDGATYENSKPVRAETTRDDHAGAAQLRDGARGDALRARGGALPGHNLLPTPSCCSTARSRTAWLQEPSASSIVKPFRALAATRQPWGKGSGQIGRSQRSKDTRRRPVELDHQWTTSTKLRRDRRPPINLNSFDSEG